MGLLRPWGVLLSAASQWLRLTAGSSGLLLHPGGHAQVIANPPLGAFGRAATGYKRLFYEILLLCRQKLGLGGRGASVCPRGTPAPAAAVIPEAPKASCLTGRLPGACHTPTPRPHLARDFLEAAL